MPETTSAEPGMDAFDFLYELWRAKWLFLGVFAITVAGGLALLVPVMTQEEANRFTARFPFTVGTDSDPLSRNGGSILQNYLAHLDPQHTLQLVDASRRTGGQQSSRTFVATVDPTTHRGTLTVTATDVEPSFFRGVHEELQRAAVAQVEATRTSVDRELALLQTVAREYGGGNTEFSAGRAFSMLRFLNDPRLEAGEFRLMVFEAFDAGAVARDSLGGNTSLKRRLTISVLLGSVFGLLVVMFRVAIQRKGRRAAV